MTARTDAQRALDEGYIIADERYSLDASTYLSIIERYEEALKGLLAESAVPETDEALRDTVSGIIDEQHGPMITEGGCDFRARWTNPYRQGRPSEVNYDDAVDEVIAAVSVARVREILTLLNEEYPGAAFLVDSALGARHPNDVAYAAEHLMKLPKDAYREIRARLAQEDVPIHVSADIEQIICETGGDFGNGS